MAMMTSQPQFFIIRPTSDGHHSSNESRIVPLIPIDLLPEWIDVKGVPRQLALEETAGMTNLGSFAVANERLKLRFLNLCHGQEKIEAKQWSLSGSLSVTDNEQVESGQASALKCLGGDLQQPEDSSGFRSNAEYPAALEYETEHLPCRLTPSSNAAENARHQITNNTKGAILSDPTISHEGVSSVDRNPPLAKRCQQWCHHGYCSRGGSCPLRHEMPQTAEGLAAMGLASWPPWWRRKRFAQPSESVSGSSKDSPKIRNSSRGWKMRKERKKERITDGQLTLRSTEETKSLSGLHESSGEGLGEAANGTGKENRRIESEEEPVESLIDM